MQRGFKPFDFFPKKYSDVVRCTEQLVFSEPVRNIGMHRKKSFVRICGALYGATWSVVLAMSYFKESCWAPISQWRPWFTRKNTPAMVFVLTFFGIGITLEQGLIKISFQNAPFLCCNKNVGIPLHFFEKKCNVYSPQIYIYIVGLDLFGPPRPLQSRMIYGALCLQYACCKGTWSTFRGIHCDRNALQEGRCVLA